MSSHLILLAGICVSWLKSYGDSVFNVAAPTLRDRSLVDIGHGTFYHLLRSSFLKVICLWLFLQIINAYREMI